METIKKRIIIFFQKNVAIFTCVSTIIALTSLIISFKPFLGKEKIFAEGAKELMIYQTWGDLELSHYFYLGNSGSKQGVITSFEGLIVSNPKGYNPKFIKRYFVAKSFHNKQNDYYYPIANIRLNPNEKTDCYFYMSDDISDEDKRTIANFKDMIRDDLFYNMNDSVYSTKNYINQRLSASVEDYAMKKYEDFVEGNYQYIVELKVENRSNPIIQCYDFKITEYDLYILEESIKLYGMRRGVQSLLYPEGEFIVQLSEIKDKDAIKRLHDDLHQLKKERGIPIN